MRKKKLPPPVRTRGRKPLPPEMRLEDGLPRELREWLAQTSQRLQISQQFIIRVAIARLRKNLNGKEAEIELRNAQND